MGYGSMACGSIACGYISCGYTVCGSGVAFGEGSISVPLGNKVIV